MVKNLIKDQVKHKLSLLSVQNVSNNTNQLIRKEMASKDKIIELLIKEKSNYNGNIGDKDNKQFEHPKKANHDGIISFLLKTDLIRLLSRIQTRTKEHLLKRQKRR